MSGKHCNKLATSAKTHHAQQRPEDADVELVHLVAGAAAAARGCRDRPGPHGAAEVPGHHGHDRPLRHRHGLHRLSSHEGGLLAESADRKVRVGVGVEVGSKCKFTYDVRKRLGFGILSPFILIHVAEREEQRVPHGCASP